MTRRINAVYVETIAMGTLRRFCLNAHARARANRTALKYDQRRNKTARWIMAGKQRPQRRRFVPAAVSVQRPSVSSTLYSPSPPPTDGGRTSGKRWRGLPSAAYKIDRSVIRRRKKPADVRFAVRRFRSRSTPRKRTPPYINSAQKEILWLIASVFFLI